MSTPPRVFIVCSFDKGLQKLAECVRRDYPSARIEAVVPRGQALTESEARHLDGVIESNSRTLSAFGGFFALLCIARQLRAARPEEVVLQFESLKLRCFGLACRPKRLRAWLGNGQRLEFPLSLRENLADLAAHRVRGYAATLRAAWHAYVVGFRNEPPERR
ncbi:MAG: hypothetical protein RLZZ303_703 [Candidatus Hydrogenedentota bacterium]|jgi:hypothetical protein